MHVFTILIDSNKTIGTPPPFLLLLIASQQSLAHTLHPHSLKMSSHLSRSTPEDIIKDMQSHRLSNCVDRKLITQDLYYLTFVSSVTTVSAMVLYMYYYGMPILKYTCHILIYTFEQ